MTPDILGLWRTGSVIRGVPPHCTPPVYCSRLQLPETTKNCFTLTKTKRFLGVRRNLRAPMVPALRRKDHSTNSDSDSDSDSGVRRRFGSKAHSPASRRGSARRRCHSPASRGSRATVPSTTERGSVAWDMGQVHGKGRTSRNQEPQQHQAKALTRMAARAGVQVGVELKPFVNRMPDRPSASRWGVLGLPPNRASEPSASTRSWRGRAGGGWGRGVSHAIVYVYTALFWPLSCVVDGCRARGKGAAPT